MNPVTLSGGGGGWDQESNTATDAVRLQRSNKITLFTSYLYISHTVRRSPHM